MTLTNNRGMSIIVLAVIIVAVGLLGAGIVGFIGAKQKSYPYPVNSFRALQIANAGVECAIRCTADSACTIPSPPSSCLSVTFPAGSASTFCLSRNTIDDVLTSTGTYNNISRVVALRNFASYVDASRSGISFESGPYNFFQPGNNSPITTEDDTGDPSLAVRVDPIAQTIDLGQITYTYKFGAIWYSGNYPAANCVDGNCDFGKGIRAFFLFNFASSSQADGFVFALINGADNDKTSIGGDSRLGELIAFAGDSRTYDPTITSFRDRKEGRGIRPPKIGVEFDTWYNASRNDTLGSGASAYAPENHHMAYVLWGDRTADTSQDVTTYTPWQQSALFSLNRIAAPSTSSYLYRVTTSGTSGTTQPTWPTTTGGTVTDSGVTWQECSWRASLNTYSIGDIVVPGTANGSYYRCSARLGAGTTSGTEPTWPTSIGATVNDGPRLVANVVRYPAGGPRYTCIRDHFSNNATNRPDRTVVPPVWSLGGTGGANWQNNTNYYTTNYVTWTNTGTIQFPGNSSTYDDNYHGAGTGTNPTNATGASDYFRPHYAASTGTGTSGSTTGFFGPVFAYRTEVVRPTATDTSGVCSAGYYKYRLMSWIKNCDNTGADTSCSLYINSTLANVNADYTVESPILDRNICLTAADHVNFNKFLFGWTEATGAATQNATVRKFKMNFRE